METPISLYLELEPKATADLEAVARATLSFAAAVKEVAYVLDPSLEVSLKFASGTEGSLSLNTILKTLKEKTTDPATLTAIGLVVLSWFGTDIRQYLMTQSLDAAFKTEKKLSPEEIQQITQAVMKAIEGKVAERNVQQVYRELEKDPAVKGVGATPEPGSKPATIVPRSEFPRYTTPLEEESIVEKRTREEPERVTLISPVLLPGERRWRFSSHEGEFGAPIKDEMFLSDVLQGRHPIVMRTGIEMDVILQTKEDKENGVWVVKERNVLKVINTSPAPTQEELELPKAAIKPNDNQDED
ncbi:hypothetical protein ABIF63_006130 [Bradyrhizobium japonicum]|uniref:Uncharacterized protein n=1 Tax=Bradyrhizobium japonicum TaxID=375 RepID=A0ABV2RYK4_BRAJP